LKNCWTRNNNNCNKYKGNTIMRWVLIRPLHKSLFYDPETQEPLGLEYLASILREQGCKVLILDSALDNLPDSKLARRAASFQPDAIGFSITTGNDMDSVRAIHSECSHALGKKTPLWLAGGNYITCEPRNADEALPPAFRLVRCEGEVAIRNICSSWSNGQIHSLPRLSDGAPVADLDALPFPQRPYHRYIKEAGWAFNMQGSRGCCSSCKYCASGGMRGRALPSWRGRSPENIARELAFLRDTCSATTFNFVDEDFLGPPARSLLRAQGLSSAIAAAGLKVTFGIQARPNSLSVDIIDLLASAGLRYVFMGIESDDPGDFSKWGRKYCADTWRWVAYLQDKEIEVNAGTLLFHPDCTLAGIKHFATKLRRHGLFNYRTAVNRMDAMPGSFFYAQYVSAHPGAYSRGIIQLPFASPEMESFYQAVVQILAPLEVPTMHALCHMPIAQTNRIFNNQEERFKLLKRISAECDSQVSSSFFRLLEIFETGARPDLEIAKMEEENSVFAKTITSQLVENGFMETPATPRAPVQM
jgi:hypothetical protein